MMYIKVRKTKSHNFLMNFGHKYQIILNKYLNQKLEILIEKSMKLKQNFKKFFQSKKYSYNTFLKKF